MSSSKLPRHPLVLAVKPIVEALGAQLVAADEREPGDLPLKWEGTVLAAVRPAPLHGALDRLPPMLRDSAFASATELARRYSGRLRFTHGGSDQMIEVGDASTATLLDMGLTHRRAVLIIYGVSVVFSPSAIR